MFDAITDVRGIQAGHAQDQHARTGCTVVLCLGGATVGVDVRGLAPGTRETDVCRPGTLVEKAHAVLLSGGSAFGLDAAAGVMRFLRERDVGFDTGVARVPIVPGAVIFDLGVGEVAWPDEVMGHEACLAATDGDVARGAIGAGTGATVGKALGPSRASRSGVGTASERVGRYTVGALVVVNAFGDVVRRDTGEVLAGTLDARGGFARSTSILEEGGQERGPSTSFGTNTTIGVVATDASLSSEQIHHLAVIAHDGLARTIEPVHTIFDGDTIFSLATGADPPLTWTNVLTLLPATVRAIERAIVSAVTTVRT